MCNPLAHEVLRVVLCGSRRVRSASRSKPRQVTARGSRARSGQLVGWTKAPPARRDFFWSEEAPPGLRAVRRPANRIGYRVLACTRYRGRGRAAVVMTRMPTPPRAFRSASRSQGAAACGAISASQNDRAVSRISLCSSESSKSMRRYRTIKKSRRVGGAFVHPTNWPLRAREPLAVTWRSFDLLALRTRRDPQSTTRSTSCARGAPHEKSARTEIYAKTLSARSAST